MSEPQSLFVVYCDPEVAPATLDHDTRDSETCTLAQGLFLARTTQTQSQLYHRTKRQLPEGAALLVVRAAEIPKFKSLAPGSTRWARGNDR